MDKSFSSNIFLANLDKFDITISYTSFAFTIEVKSSSWNSTLSETIFVSEICSKTSFLFNHPREMFDGFKEALLQTDPNISLTISDEGRLSYRWTCKMGKMNKEFSFDIQLKDKYNKSSEGSLADVFLILGKLEKKIDAQDDIIQNLVQENDALKLENKNLYQELSKLQDRIESIPKITQKDQQEEKNLEKSNPLENGKDTELETQDIQFKFDTASTQSDYYEFSNDNTTIMCQAIDEHYRLVYATKPLEKSKITRFKVKIEKAFSVDGIAIGVLPSNMKYSRYGFGIGAIAYHIIGSIFQDGEEVSSVVEYSGGSTVSFLVDLINYKYRIFKDSVVVYEGNLDKDIEYLPYAELAINGDMVSFV